MTFCEKKTGISLAATAAMLFLGAWAQPVLAQESLPDGPVACDAFQRGPNGSWTAVRPATISPNGVRLHLAPGQTFAKNQFIGGIEVTTVLDRNCGNE
jgi:hypothetical protein